MPTDPNCIFCKIIAGKIPCHKVYDDEVVLAFLDIGPIVKGHTLVIPKEHYATVMEIPPEVLAAVQSRVPQIARAVLGATGAKACHLLANNGSEAQQSVHHLHFHILPRTEGDGFHVPWTPGSLEKAAGTELAGAISQRLK